MIDPKAAQWYIKAMIGSVSHDFQEETIESKARWFQSLPVSERIELLCLFTDLVFENNPTIAERKNDQPAGRRIRILSRASS
jgi:hypothetical protein